MDKKLDGVIAGPQSVKSAARAITVVSSFQIFGHVDGTKDHGKYCEVWEKKADGKWKVATDMFSSDLPAPGVSPSPATGAAEKK